MKYYVLECRYFVHIAVRKVICTECTEQLGLHQLGILLVEQSQFTTEKCSSFFEDIERHLTFACLIIGVRRPIYIQIFSYFFLRESAVLTQNFKISTYCFFHTVFG